jgi:hypothetical protein
MILTHYYSDTGGLRLYLLLFVGCVGICGGGDFAFPVPVGAKIRFTALAYKYEAHLTAPTVNRPLNDCVLAALFVDYHHIVTIIRSYKIRGIRY